jgi:hypothetical protein
MRNDIKEGFAFFSDRLRGIRQNNTANHTPSGSPPNNKNNNYDNGNSDKGSTIEDTGKTDNGNNGGNDYITTQAFQQFVQQMRVCCVVTTPLPILVTGIN